MSHPIIKAVTLVTFFAAQTAVAQETDKAPQTLPNLVDEIKGGEDYCESPDGSACTICETPKQKTPFT